MKLLTPMQSNPKTAKNKGHGYLTAILHLAPSTLSGVNVCPNASKGCKEVCLNTAGRGRMNPVQEARLRKTKLLLDNRKEFFRLLNKDIKALIRKAERLNLKPAIRLNGTSDIAWEAGSLMAQYPEVQFYDYTKTPIRLTRLLNHKSKNRRLNYHLTFSASESNTEDCKQALKLGYNVAVVFRDKIPDYFWNRPVVDGDKHDLRFLDPKDSKGFIIGLIAKGRAKTDKSGFVKESIGAC